MVLLEDEKIAFFHIPKCGGTSISLALEEVARWNDRFIGGTVTGEFMNKTWAINFHIRKHSTPVEFLNAVGELVYERYKKFIVVRHPISRFMSAYNFMRLHAEAKTEWIMPSVETYGFLRYRNIDDFVFSDFMENVGELHKKWAADSFRDLTEARIFDGVKLFAPQSIYIDDRETGCGRFNFFKIEESARFDGFMASIGFSRVTQLKIHNANDKKQFALSCLSGRAVSRLVDLYLSDFTNFNYHLPVINTAQ